VQRTTGGGQTRGGRGRGPQGGKKKGTEGGRAYVKKNKSGIRCSGPRTRESKEKKGAERKEKVWGLGVMGRRETSEKHNACKVTGKM